MRRSALERPPGATAPTTKQKEHTMFGFGAGRIGPTDATLADLEAAARRGWLTPLPTFGVVNLSDRLLSRLRELHRTEVVTAAESLGAEARGQGPTLRAGSLDLPAREFLIEMEPLPGDIASRRIGLVMRQGHGSGATLLVQVFTQLADDEDAPRASVDEWTMTTPGVMPTLGEAQPNPALATIASPAGLERFQHEVSCAALGIEVVAARHRELVRGARP
jgi:hypothetical protein